MTETIVSNLSVSIGEKDILRNINFSIKSGETIGLIGPNGSGKTTLMRSILGLQKLSKGEVFVGGENIKIISKNHFAENYKALGGGRGAAEAGRAAAVPPALARAAERRMGDFGPQVVANMA